MQYLQQNTPLLGGKYKIIRHISSGGFGNTYEGYDTYLDKKVAIKEFFVKDFCKRESDTTLVSVTTEGKRPLIEHLKQKFIEEARAIAKMEHENIVKVQSLFEENGTAYYVMDFIEGESIHELIKRCGSLPEEEAVAIILKVASALDYMHKRNRLHLDVKPANIMLRNDGKVILIDFGSSKQYAEVGGENTTTIAPCYTPGYAPAEQMNPTPTTFTSATDIYALGATLYKMLTGQTPPSAIDLVNGEKNLPQLPNEISVKTRECVERAMIAQRKERMQKVSDFEAYFLQESENNDVVVDQSEDENLTEQIDIQKEEGKIYFSTCSFIIICVLICFTCILYCGWINRSLFLEIMTSGISLITGFVCLIGIFYTVTVCHLFTDFHELIKNKKIWPGVVTGSIGLFVLLYFYITFNTYDINYRNSITGWHGGWNFSKLSSQSIETFTANGVSFEMVKVSGGKFFMGANVKYNNPNKPNTPRDDDGNSNESPAHIVTVGSFYIGRTEVTQELWQAVMGDNPSNFNGNKKPVEYVNWYDCQKFINKLNELTGENFRLPTEAEWEFAAKGGKESRGNQYSGSNNLADVAWYKDNSNSTTHEVCQKSPNELGIYDMSGNVSEWCHDGPRSYSVWGRPVNPIGANDSCRVVRGGSYTFDAKGCRSSFRNWNNLDSRFVNVGLRLALCK